MSTPTARARACGRSSTSCWISRSPARNTAALIDQLQLLRQRGLEVILVTSGAIPLGMSILGKRVRPKELAKVQGLSAVGQCALMRHYENACEKHRTHCAQLLLTAADLRDRERNTHVAACMRGLLDEGILPIINENDSVTVAEIKIGDNDTLAAMGATMLGVMELNGSMGCLTTANGARVRDVPFCHDYAQKGADKQGIH